MLAEAFEAVLGAVYVDGGLLAVHRVMARLSPLAEELGAAVKRRREERGGAWELDTPPTLPPAAAAAEQCGSGTKQAAERDGVSGNQAMGRGSSGGGGGKQAAERSAAEAAEQAAAAKGKR
jgi:dsRNA-specific ribonuclease